MELGEKIRKARLERGLSQQQLCGQIITRNMLSRIEHGAARPSMDTLRHLAGQLGLPMSYFLEEDALSSPNQQALQLARQAFRQRDWGQLKSALEQFQTPDPVFQPEWELLQYENLLEQARQALRAGQKIYARDLLEAAATLDQGLYVGKELPARRMLLLSQADGDPAKLAAQLPSVDDLILLRARAANPEQALSLLAAVENKSLPLYFLLLGKAHYDLGDHASALEPLRQAEQAYGETVRPMLEICFRELGDFRRAYEYACKQR